MGTEREIDRLRSRLEEIAVELGEVAMERLREALSADDAPGASAAAVANERRINRARRAVEKAAALLGSQSGPG